MRYKNRVLIWCEDLEIRRFEQACITALDWKLCKSEDCGLRKRLMQSHRRDILDKLTRGES